MRALLSVLLLAATLGASPVRAEDGGPEVTFQGSRAARRISVPPGSRPGDLLWGSGPSDGAREAFEALLLQGNAAEPGVSFEAAVKGPGGWGPWVAGEAERFPNGRFWARIPVAGGKGAQVRVRAVNRGIRGGRAVELFGLELAPAEREAPGVSPPSFEEPPPSTGPVRPPVIPREEWGAAPAASPYEPMNPARLTIHHTEAAQPFTPEDAVQEMRIIQRFHQKGRGWIDIGYHFLIDGSGRIYQGRPETVVGAHVRNKNEGNVGISLMGSFHPPRSHEPTPEQVRSLVALGRWLVAAYGIDPGTIKGHRDHQATSCPGDGFYPRLGEIRREIGQPPAVVLLKMPAPSRAALPFDLPPDEATLKALFDGRNQPLRLMPVH